MKNFVHTGKQLVLIRPILLPAFALAFWFAAWPANTFFWQSSAKKSSPKSIIQQPNDAVQFVIPGNFTAPFEYLNDIPASGVDLDGNGSIDLIRACSCRNQPVISNGSNPNSGYFDDQIVVATGISGQQWRVADSDKMFLRSSLIAVPQGTLIPEIGTTGVYILKTAMRDANQAYAIVTSTAYPGEEFGPVINACYYPDPLIENLNTFYCDNEPSVSLYGSATSDFDGNIFPLTAAGESWSITRMENGQVFNTQTFSPATLGEGTYKVRFTFDIATPAHGAFNQTGCSATVEQQVIVRGTNSLSCNGTINVTLNPNTCVIPVVPTMLLSGNPITTDYYTVEVYTQAGQLIGDTITADYAGQTLLGVIIDDCTGLFCLTDIVVRDFTQPTLNVPPNLTISCTASSEPENTGFATAIDCTPVELTYQDQWSETACGNPKVRIFRTWRAVDAVGNVRTKIQTISIARGTQAELRFPEDVTFSCEDYQADPSIIDAAADKAGIPNLVDNSLCGLAYSYLDQHFDLCGNPDVSFTIRREWFVIDACGNTVFNTDGLGNDKFQFITVRDQTPPSVTAPPVVISALVSPMVNGLGYCTGSGFIPPPDVTDGCNAFTIKIYTPIGEAEYFNGTNGNAGGTIPFPGLALGVHEIIYEVTDACSNMTTTTGMLEVIDDQPPMMICDNAITFTLPSNGTARLRPNNIDEGSRDDCCVGAAKIKLVDEPDELFRDSIDFYCTNATVEVVLRVWDCAGNFNECSSLVTVEDRVPPYVVQGVPNRTVSCQSSNLAQFLNETFDAPQFADNCNFNVQFLVTENLNSCNVGTITRRWTATDNPNNVPTIVTQVITVNQVTDYDLVIPQDVALGCGEADFPNVGLSASGCDSITISVAETIEDVPGVTECYRIVRTHTITNWCEYDGTSAAFELPRGTFTPAGESYTLRSDGDFLFWQTLAGPEINIGPSTGRYTYRQIIRITDANAPEISSQTEPQIVCLPETGACTGAVTYNFTITDNCPEGVTVFHSLMLNNQTAQADVFGSLTSLGESAYRISGQYPRGQHTFIVSASDNCGNVTQVSLPFEVRDCTAPTLSCSGGTFQLNANNELTLAPADVISNTFDNCSEVTLSFAPNSSVTSLSYGCDSVGLRQVNVWATDSAGNQSTCNVEVMIADAENPCSSFWNVSGRLRTENDLGIGQADVKIDGPFSFIQTTGSDGFYSFEDIPEGMGYKVEPEKDTFHINGISTLDLILISRHVLSISFLTSPYKIIAADANRSGNVSTVDLIMIRRLILQLDTAFTLNSSWRFVPESYTFPNPANPFAQNFPESVIIEELNRDTVINFIGMKIGDVNGSNDPAALQQIEPRSDRSLILGAPDARLEAGKIYTLPIATTQTDALGFQGELSFDPEVLEFVELKPDGSMRAANFGFAKAEAGLIGMSWDQFGADIAPSAELVFRAKAPTTWQSAIRVKPEGLRPESYFITDGGNIAVGGLVLEFDPLPDAGAFELLGCYPNPLQSFGDIRFRTSAEAQVQLAVYDMTGRLVLERSGNFSQGLHSFRIEQKDLPGQGLYFYEISNGEVRMADKLIMNGRN